MRHDRSGRLVGQILLDVDDLIFGAKHDEMTRVKTHLHGKYVFGKWVEG